MSRDWNDFIAQIRRCSKCPRPQESYPVFSPIQKARVLLIGQAPGSLETKKGIPFIGQAGRRLFKWLAGKGIEEEDFRKIVYITQVVKCFPGKGQFGDLKPSREMIKNCLPYLKEEIIKLDPKIIIPVGALAIEYTIGKRKLGDVIGEKLTRNIYGKRRVIIPLPHPSGVSVWTISKKNLRRMNKALNLLREVLSPNLTTQS